ncbi:hypothetical protein LTR65_004615 [Meristemomyces frigidus]
MSSPPQQYVNLRDLEKEHGQLGDDGLAQAGSRWEAEGINPPYSPDLSGIPQKDNIVAIDDRSLIGAPAAQTFEQERGAYHIDVQPNGGLRNVEGGNEGGGSVSPGSAPPSGLGLGAYHPDVQAGFPSTRAVQVTGPDDGAGAVASSQERRPAHPVKPWACSHAKHGRRYFNSLNELKKHERSHIPKKEQKYACTYPDCPKRFLYAKDRLRHLKTHSPDIFFCAVCAKDFTRADYVDRHMRSDHPELQAAATDGEIYGADLFDLGAVVATARCVHFIRRESPRPTPADEAAIDTHILFQ